MSNEPKPSALDAILSPRISYDVFEKDGASYALVPITPEQMTNAREEVDALRLRLAQTELALVDARDALGREESEYEPDIRPASQILDAALGRIAEREPKYYGVNESALKMTLTPKPRVIEGVVFTPIYPADSARE